jgi:hypothetical protein
VFLGTKNHLCDSVAVAEVDKYDTTVITAGIDPAAKNGMRPRVRLAQSAAMYRPISHRLKN